MPVGKKKEEEEAAVSSEQENNKALVRRFLEATARADLDAMDEMMVPEFAYRSLMPGQEPDREGSCTQKRTAGPCALGRRGRGGSTACRRRRPGGGLRSGSLRQPRVARISPRPVTSGSRPVSLCSEPPTKEET
jgi:hypothetical protein